MAAERDLLVLCEGWLERVLAAAGRGAEAEVFVQETRGTTVKVFGGEVEDLRYSHQAGVGIRVIVEGKLGYAYSTGLEAEKAERAVEEAIRNAGFSSPDPHNLLPDRGAAAAEDLEIYSPEAEELAPGEKVKKALELERLTLEQDKRISKVETAAYTDAVTDVAVANSKGLRGYYRSSDCFCYAYPIAEESGEAQTGFSFDVGIRPSDLDLEKVAKEASWRATVLLGSRSMPSRRTTVILDNIVAAEFMGLLSSALSAEAVLKGRSFLAGREGERIASADVEVVDDGLLPGGPATAPFDDEGVPMGRKVLVEKGVLKGYLHNTYTASRAGVKSTGNARRGSFRERPRVGASNLFLVPGKGGRDDVVREVGEGVYVMQVVGIHAGANPVSGEISLGALGLRVKGGELAGPLREITLAGKAVEFLQGVVVVGGDLRFLPFEGGLGAPTVAVEGVMVSGRGS